MKRHEIMEMVDEVIMSYPHLKKNESMVYEIIKVVVLHFENRLNGKV